MSSPLSLIAARFAALEPRERRLVGIAATVIALAGLITFTEWVWSERARLADSLPQAHSALIRMQDEAAELTRLQRTSVPAPPPIATLAQTASAAASARGLTLEITVAGNVLRAEGSGAINAITEWLATVQADQRLRPVRVVIEADQGVGRVEATLSPP